MDKNYLYEAFQAMNLLEEEDFRLDDTGVKDILDFKDHDELNDIIDVYDPEAETEEEVKDTYIGDVVLECTVCHSPIFKAVEDVEIDEDSDVANIEDECPICHSQDGFKVIGQIAPFVEDPEVNVEVEDKIDSVEDDLGDGQGEEKVEESLNEAVEDELGVDTTVEETDNTTEEVEEVADKIAEVVADIADDVAEIVADNTEDPVTVTTTVEFNVGDETAEAEETTEESATEVTDESLTEGHKNTRYDQITNDLYGFTSSKRNIKPNNAEGEHAYSAEQIAATLSDDNIIRVSANTPEELNFAIRVAEFYKAPYSEIKEFESSSEPGTAGGKYYIDIDPDDELFEPQDGPIEVGENLAEAKKDCCPECGKNPCECEKKDDTLEEGLERVDLETEDKIIHVSEEEKEPTPDAEMITPVSDELSAELTDPIEDTELAVEEPVEDTSFIDNAANELEAEDDEEPIEDEEDIDYDVDDFDENEFDDLGESYLKKVYENVESFKTSAVKSTDDSLIVEGIIKFNSGKEKTTQFIFEAADADSKGKVRFIGENAQITRGKKAFTLTGNISDKKFIAESLNYNYTANKQRVYGTVKKEK